MILNRQLRSQGLAPVKHKRVYRIMWAHDLLLARKYPERPGHGHDAKVIVTRLNLRWCSDGFGRTGRNGDIVRGASIIDAHDREIIARRACGECPIFPPARGNHRRIHALPLTRRDRISFHRPAAAPALFRPLSGEQVIAIHNVKLVEKRQITDGTMEFIMEKPEGFQFRAGQFLDIVLHGATGAPKSDYIHGFSIVAAPSEDYIAIATRMRGTTFKEALRALPDGSEVKLDASYGAFTLPREITKPIVYLIGGIGVTPVRSMIAQATHDRSAQKLTLIHANSKPANAPFAADFKGFARDNPDFTFVRAFSDSIGDDKEAESGQIDAAMIRRHVPDIAGTLFSLSGPPGMVRAIRTILMDELKVNQDNIRTKKFDGY